MANSDEFFAREVSFRAESRVDRAVLICAFLKAFEGKPTCSLREIRLFFERSHLAQPAGTVLSSMLAVDSRVSIRAGVVRSLVKGDAYLKEIFPELFVSEVEEPSRLSKSTRATLQKTPLIDSNYLNDLENMLELYATLHVLENSMRRLIEQVLLQNFGPDWWTKTSSQPQKNKHADRLDKEQNRKWLPARSGLGPLYSLDWSDLISLMRKHENIFRTIVGDIDFLHRFSDLGLLRHVIAHHGFIDNPHDFERVRLALHDWQMQVGTALTT